MVSDLEKNVRAQPLSATAFADFGEVIAPENAAKRITINTGTAERFHDLANINPGPNGTTTVSIFRGQPRPLPFAISMLERHPLGSQAFVPLSGHPYLIVVAPKGDTVDVENIRFFIAQANQGINFAPGVWHHPLLALDGESDFLVIDRSGPGNNCDEQALPITFLIDR